LEGAQGTQCVHFFCRSAAYTGSPGLGGAQEPQSTCFPLFPFRIQCGGEMEEVEKAHGWRIGNLVGLDDGGIR